jgi:putative transposase
VVQIAEGRIGAHLDEVVRSWTAFLRELRERGLKGVKLFVFDKCLGLVENLVEFYPEAHW